MPTIEFDDQFTVAPAKPVRQPRDIVSILQRNVADLEIALKQQTERAEAAEEKLTTAREDMQSWIDSRNGWMERAERAEKALKEAQEQEPVAYVKYKATGGNVGLSWVAIPTGAFYPREGEQLYAAPSPAAPAVAVPAVPEEWREVMARLLDTFERCEAGFHPHVEIRLVVRYEARALLQSAAVKDSLTAAPDCRTCANRGRINGLSQESYCDSCVWQGMSSRKNHFVDASKMADAVKRRCDACAVLPCSCE